MTAEIKENLSLETQLKGEELEGEMAGGISGEVGVLLSRHLANHVYPNRLGRVFGAQTDFELKGVGRRQPDVAFVALERLPVNVRDAVPVPPDLAVEVYSKSDNVYDMGDKIQEYFSAGVRLVWVVQPVTKIVEIYHPNAHKPITLGIDDELDGENVVPGFKIKVSALFEY